MTNLKLVWSWIRAAWMAFARVLGIANTALLLTIVYILLLGPAAIFAWILRKDLLHHRRSRGVTFWKERNPLPQSIEQARHQF